MVFTEDILDRKDIVKRHNGDRTVNAKVTYGPAVVQMLVPKPAKFVSWCFEPSQPPWITSGLRKTLIKRHIVERTSKAELRSEERSEKSESCWENF